MESNLTGTLNAGLCLVTVLALFSTAGTAPDTNRE